MSVIHKISPPSHLGIIMDGNGRWARSKNLPRVAGHRQGAKTVDKIVTSCRKLGVKYLTLYAFSFQNWSRPSLEVSALMGLLSEYIKKERKTILENNITLTSIGQISLLPTETQKVLSNLIEESKSNTGMTLCLALSYGGQEEIIAAARSIATLCVEDKIKPNDINISLFNSHIWSSKLGPLDLLIRTSGELRISNFLLWSCAYSEFYFSDKMWPDFDETDLQKAFIAFTNRNRRFGNIGK